MACTCRFRLTGGSTRPAKRVGTSRWRVAVARYPSLWPDTMALLEMRTDRSESVYGKRILQLLSSVFHVTIAICGKAKNMFLRSYLMIRRPGSSLFTTVRLTVSPLTTVAV